VSGAEDEKVFMIGAAAACALMNSAGVGGVRSVRSKKLFGSHQFQRTDLQHS
jgi:hypothetical protein